MMISAALLFLAGATTAPAHGHDTIRHLKGHHSLPVTRVATDGRKAAAICHSDPLKGRACRHNAARNETQRQEALAHADRRDAGSKGSAW